MIEIYLIRHGMTYGNSLGRYIGATDEALCEEGKTRIQAGKYPSADVVYCSPMRRCRETAQLIYPEQELRIEDRFRECNFGTFENKNYKELSDDPDYQAWVDSGGTLPFPNGESREAFAKRCREGFLEMLDEIWQERKNQKGQPFLGPEQKEDILRVALVVHGGTVMSILEAYGEPREPYYRWNPKNGEGFRVLLDEKAYEEKKEVRLHEIHDISPFAGISD